MLDSAIDRMANWVTDSLFGSLAQSAGFEKEQWIPADQPVLGCMSLYRGVQSGSMGVYYCGAEVTSEELSRCYRQIESKIPCYGERIASSLLAPFQGHFSDSQQSWLSDDIISRFFKSLRSNRITTIDPAYFHKQDFIESLSNTQKRLAEHLCSADLLFWPVCGENNHWYLMVIERIRDNRFSINVLDSYNDTASHGKIAEKGVALLNKLYHGQIQLINMRNPTYLVPVQDNNSDCGASIAYYAYQKSRGQALSVYEEHSRRKCSYVQFRMHMAKQIEAQALADGDEFARSESPTLLTNFRRIPSCSEIIDLTSSSEMIHKRTIKIC